ncbi:MAG TPA: O-antigen ligase family protein, partial [Victivallales bacterium]|nr:O-antigen ligase family protein [Victivallales bacterium]
LFSLHFAGLAVFAFGMMITLRTAPESGMSILRALVLGTCAASYHALYQLLWGFKRGVEFVKQRELETGVKASNDLWIRIVQTRVFSPFSLCNNLAAHLILMIPLVFTGIFFDRKLARWAVALSAIALFLLFFDSYGAKGLLASVLVASFLFAAISTNFFDEHHRGICIISAALLSLFLLFILKHTFSRGAVMSLGISLAIVPFLLKLSRRLKMAYAVLALFLFSVLFVIVNQNRSILENSSANVRVDYWICATEMFLKKPFLGTGWGDFFHEYTFIKRFPNTEAPHTAHNIILDFASQCGVVGLVAISALFAGTILLAWKRISKDDGVSFCRFDRVAIFCGLLAWLIHSLSDINFQVPATVASAIILSLLAVHRIPSEGGKIRFAKFAIVITALPVLFFAIERFRGEIYFDRLYRISEPVSGGSDKSSPDKMEKALYQAAKAMPYSPYPWASAGVYAQERRMWGISENFFSEALKRSPERASFSYRLGIAQFKTGNFGKALESFRKASELFPKNEEYRSTYEDINKKFGDNK